jgi:hypothetical protein
VNDDQLRLQQMLYDFTSSAQVISGIGRASVIVFSIQLYALWSIEIAQGGIHSNGVQHAIEKG